MSFPESYAFFDAWVVEALRELGVDAWYAPLNDITSTGGKIGGAAQARRGGAVLHHTTMAYQMNMPLMLQVLRIGQEKLSDKGDPLRREARRSPAPADRPAAPDDHRPPDRQLPRRVRLDRRRRHPRRTGRSRAPGARALRHAGVDLLPSLTRTVAPPAPRRNLRAPEPIARDTQDDQTRPREPTCPGLSCAFCTAHLGNQTVGH